MKKLFEFSYIDKKLIHVIYVQNLTWHYQVTRYSNQVLYLVPGTEKVS
jgi:hypothetical protein